jgi:CheY-like chemotaxis protein
LTSLGSREARADAVSFTAFLTKPIKMSALFDTLISILAVGPPLPLEEGGDQGVQIDPTMGQTTPLRILLAEDNATNQKLAVALLGRLGYRPDVAANGREAVDALARQPYDLVLMDVQMPEMDGFDATRHVRRVLPPERQPRIVAMTANAMQGDREACLAAGMDDYVSKPIRLNELIRVLSFPPRVPGAGYPLAGGGAGSAPLDPAGMSNLLEILGGDFADLATIIDTWLEDLPRLLGDLGDYAAKGDAAGVQRMAHSLKSNAADFGATSLAAMCQGLELAARDHRLDGLNDAIALIRTEASAVASAVRGIREAGTLLS